MSKKDLQKLKVQEEVEKTLHDYCVEGGHTFPRSRREFLSSGLISLSATVMAPTLFSLINNRAQAAEGCPVGDPSLSPFIQINLAGGAALCANFVAGDEQGNLLSSYQRMGLGTTPSLTRVCSNQAPFATGSGFLSGLQAGANAATLSTTGFVSMSAFSFDDTPDNEQNIIGLVAHAGQQGLYLPTTLASSQIRDFGQVQVSNSKYFSSPAFMAPPSPLKVDSVGSLMEALTLQTPTLNDITGVLSSQQSLYQTLMGVISDLSKFQLNAMRTRTPSSEEFKKLMKCAHEQNDNFVQANQSLPNLNIEQESGLSSFWLNDSDLEKNKILGSIVLSTLKRVSGPAFIQLGGYDYHQGAGSRPKANEMDEFAGKLVGRILRTAKLLNTPVFIYVTSDGSAFSNESSSNTVGFAGDRATHAMNFMFGFKPSVAPQMGAEMGPSYQLNHFDKVGLEVNTLHLVGKSVPLSSAAAFLNYLSFSGKMGLLSKPELQKVKQAITDAGSLEEVLRFKG
ncbi:MAG: hypothetical protein KDD33_04755 [Bdellovibrionales bacterium]|nr:hypothetical protein [Bdellovibrionales bacterium]